LHLDADRVAKGLPAAPGWIIDAADLGERLETAPAASGDQRELSLACHPASR
jgi:hypothetical protein